MKTFKLLLTSALLLTIVGGCDKEILQKDFKDVLSEAVEYEAMVYLKTSNYERIEAEELLNSGTCSEYYAGAIEYYEKGDLSARVDFGETDQGDGQGSCGGDKSGDADQGGDKGGDKDAIDKDHRNRGADRKARCSDQRGERELHFRKDRGHGSEYDKVVVEPIVKSEDCDHIVAGTICFYDDKEWVATIDFGEGTCDDIATKTTKDGTTIFSLKDKKKWGK